MLDVLGLGCVAVDETLWVAKYPTEDAKTPLLRRQRSAGGATANALCAAARLGANVAYAGTLGEDADSQFAIDDFARHGVQTKWIRRDTSARPIHAIVINAANGSRTILYDLNGARGAEPDWPPPAAIAATKFLLIDQFGMDGAIRAARIVHESGGQVIADIERTDRAEFAPLLPLIDFLFMPLTIAQVFVSSDDPAVAAKSLGPRVRQLAILTAGEAGLWYHGAQLGCGRLAAQQVEVCETTGCGDVLRGAFTAALVRGEPVRSALDCGVAAAGIAAQRTGGRDRYPTWPEIQAMRNESPA